MGIEEIEAVDITAAAIASAREAGRSVVKHTPVTASAALSDRTGGSIVLKAENMQRTGSFKIRGAMNKLASLGELARNGVTAGSAGNHAQALAFAARTHGIPCEIFVPRNAPIAKIAACRTYGATVVEGAIRSTMPWSRPRPEPPKRECSSATPTTTPWWWPDRPPWVWS